MNPGFDLKIKDKIAKIILNRPQKKNSLLPEFWKEFPACIEELSRSGNCRVVILSAEGDDFCSGMDLSVFAKNDKLKSDTAYQREQLYQLILLLQKSITVLEQSRIPVLASIQGRCLGAGLDIVSACDLRFATEDAQFRIEETNIGIMADLGSLQRLPKLLPEGIAKEMAFTGSALNAQRAWQIGFINQLFKDISALEEGVLKIAECIVAKPPLVVSASKQSINHARDHATEDSLENAALRQSQIFDIKEIMEYMQYKAQNLSHPKDLQALHQEL